MAMAGQMLLALIAADAGAFFLDSGGGGVWCQREEYLARLKLEGVTVVDETGAAWDIGEVTVCDDGAVVKPRKKAKKRKAAPKPLARAVKSAAQSDRVNH